MKNLLIAVALLFAATIRAQVEIAPREDTQKAALQLNNALGTPADVPFKLETDIINAFAIRAGEVAMLTVPVHSLKHKLETARDGEIVPVGQLWLHKIVPEVDGQSASKDRLRTVVVNTDGGSDEIVMCHLAVRKDTSMPELWLYGKGKEILRALPLRSVTVPQEAPIELDGRKRDDESGQLSIYLGDLYEARMIVRPQATSQ